MATETSPQISCILSTLMIVSFGLVCISCLESTDELQVRCELVEARFVSSNGIKVWWNVTGRQSRDLAGSFKCQLSISYNSCNDPMMNYEADMDSRSYVPSHTFWIDDKGTKSYKVCIRTVSVSPGDEYQEEWTEKTLKVKERMSPVIGNCSVSIETKEVKRIRFEKTEIYLYRHGDTITFSCPVDGQPFPRIKWCKNTIECSENVSSNPVVGGRILNARKQDEGSYMAVVENDFGCVMSEGLNIRLAVLNDFEGDDRPRSLTHKAGDSFTLTCRTPLSVPSAEIRWRKTSKNEHVPNELNKKAVLGLDGSLTILNAELSDSGDYVCNALNRILDQTVSSSHTTVEILNETIFHTQPILQDKNLPNEETVLGLVGNAARLQCIFSGRPQPTVLWFKYSTLLMPGDHGLNYSADGYTLTIFSLTLGDEGSYRCRANNSIGENQFDIKLIVQEPPRIFPSLEPRNTTEGETVAFTCLGKGTPQPTIGWKINGKTITDKMKIRLNVSLSSDQSRLTFYSVNRNRSCALQCNASNDHGFAMSSASLNVFSSTLIHNLQSIDEDGSTMLICEAQTDELTPLRFNWTLDESAISSDEVFTVFKNGSLLVNFTASKQKTDLSGNYTCLAYNGVSTAAQTILVLTLSPKKERIFQSSEIIRLSGFILFGILLAILIAMLIFLVRHKRRLRKTRKPISYGSPGVMVPQLSYSSHAETRSNDSNECLVCENDLFYGILPQNDQLKAAIRQMYIPKERIQLRDIIGKGQFGRVYAACLRDPRDFVEEVAVKTMKYKPDESEMVELFLKEAVIMRDFQHIHVLGIRGITFDSDSSPMVILPFMANGDLRRYILQPNLDITILQLLLMGLQVARGMHYLSQMRFVHRDLAARNCMVNDRGIVKVADFGLSRQLVRDYYRVESSGTTPVPVRWMAPECLEANLFTTMSDVWSFGVLLWELMTRGAVPYPDVENWQIPNHVQNGKRLEQPLYCPDIVYEIMQGCWEVEQQKRLSFQELVDSIQNVVESARPGSRVSSTLYQNIVLSGGSVSDIGSIRPSTQDYRQ